MMLAPEPTMTIESHTQPADLPPVAPQSPMETALNAYSNATKVLANFESTHPVTMLLDRAVGLGGKELHNLRGDVEFASQQLMHLSRPASSQGQGRG